MLIDICKLILSMVLSGFIGIDREKADKGAGLRTIMLVCVSCTVWSLIPAHLLKLGVVFDYSRIFAQIAAGIGFLGTAVVFLKGKNNQILEGVTTAALIFAVAVLGVIIGLGLYEFSIIYAFSIFGILKLKWIEDRWQSKHIKK